MVLSAAPAAPPVLSRHCPVCGGTEAQPHRFSAEQWRVTQCMNCGMIFLANPPAQQALHNELAWEHTKLSARAKRREGRQLYYFFSDGLKCLKRLIRGSDRSELGKIHRLCPPGGSVLDIGCADGGTLRAMAGNRWKLHGIEPSPGLAAAARTFCEANGGRVETATAMDGLPHFPAATFDLVVMRSYLEHEVHAAAVLREVTRVLKPGGAALIKVPNAACWNARLRGPHWPGVRHPDHVNYFTPRHLRLLLAACGFSRCRFDVLSRLPTSDNLWITAAA